MLYIKDKSVLKRLLLTIFTIIVIEVILGGGGRFLEVGPLSVRILIYLFIIPLTLILIILAKGIDKTTAFWTIAFSLSLILWSVIGFINNANPLLLFEDIKPLSFFYVLPFFSFVIRSKDDLDYIIKIIKLSTILMAIIYLIIILLLVFKIINFFTIYDIAKRSGEISFRNGILFFYKGFIYLCVGFFFCLLGKSKWDKFFAILLLVSIILTLTRGFILATITGIIFYLIFINKNKLIGLLTLGAFIIMVAIITPLYMETIGDKSESDIIRYIQFDQVLERTNWINFFIGDGFGNGVPIRPIHMEISYLEIFTKQGILGLLFWGGLFSHVTFLFFSLNRNKNAFSYATPFFLSVFVIYVQSATNPYLNNPIGLTMILISLTAINRIKNLEKKEHIL